MTLIVTDDQDREDMARLAGGHDASLNALIERHGARLFQYLQRLLNDEDDANDAAQETFVRVYQHRSRFDPRHTFTSWLYTIASNLARDRIRWRSRHPTLSLEVESPETGQEYRNALPDRRHTPHEAVVQDERAELVRQALAELPEDLRVPLVLAEYEGLSHAEIGKILNCSAKAVEMRIYRARQQLRRQLAPLLAE